jgi:hypothetical protein
VCQLVLQNAIAKCRKLHSARRIFRYQCLGSANLILSIAFLDRAWANQQVNVVTIVAWAGVGKWPIAAPKRRPFVIGD